MPATGRHLRALHVGVAAQRIDAATGHTNIAEQQLDHGGGADNHSNVQGFTDLGLLAQSLPGYLPLPSEKMPTLASPSSSWIMAAVRIICEPLVWWVQPSAYRMVVVRSGATR
jgi:hypothetical protein